MKNRNLLRPQAQQRLVEEGGLSDILLTFQIK